MPVSAAPSRLLSEIDRGRRVRMHSVDAGAMLQSRLTAMGLYPGVEFDIVRNDSRGPVILSVKGARLMLGRGVADKVRVTDPT